ncbi:mitochondrial import receptor subunit TOM22 homolog isoform X1 [Drosophila rhopaloa]|uniref:Mitochondrial import receptor subunit TOM22 homolog n=1 Tax=Drosophila rhopaloa TaxID=1041015 RepID=A0A6P4EYA7_DRORH|nr:mitochondrial import receptor subunit TOM22 homolog isoform X1 [Drosophila rhopaloa]
MDSDPEIEFIEKDSGMSSLGGSKDETPERRAVAATSNEPQGENYDDEPEESAAERFWGLTEMFPEPLRNAVEAVSKATVNGVKGFYTFSCNASWIFFTSSVILFAPVIFETERAQMEELQKSQQKQVLLGPSSAMGPGGSSPSLPLIR